MKCLPWARWSAVKFAASGYSSCTTLSASVASSSANKSTSSRLKVGTASGKRSSGSIGLAMICSPAKKKCVRLKTIEQNLTISTLIHDSIQTVSGIWLVRKVHEDSEQLKFPRWVNNCLFCFFAKGLVCVFSLVIKPAACFLGNQKSHPPLPKALSRIEWQRSSHFWNRNLLQDWLRFVRHMSCAVSLLLVLCPNRLSGRFMTHFENWNFFHLFLSTSIHLLFSHYLSCLSLQCSLCLREQPQKRSRLFLFFFFVSCFSHPFWRSMCALVMETSKIIIDLLFFWTIFPFLLRYNHSVFIVAHCHMCTAVASCSHVYINRLA